MSDQITVELKDLKFFAFHGLYELERKLGSDFIVNLKARYQPNEVLITEVDQTINYVSLFEIVKEQMMKPVDLLETLAMNIVQIIHDKYPVIKEIEINIEKKNPPIASFTGNVAVAYRVSY